MGDNRTAALPDGTDTIIEGAAKTEDGGTAFVEDTALVTEREIPAPRGDAERPVTGSGSPEGGLSSGGSTTGADTQGTIAERFRSGREQLSSQAGEKARGFVTQGLERTSEALANVARMV
ncbi:MAG TPA: hypothetical protein VF750_04870, partial [Sphingomicrobium sp.]